MNPANMFFASELATEGHPDKVSDQIDHLKVSYLETAAYGHFGRPEFPRGAPRCRRGAAGEGEAAATFMRDALRTSTCVVERVS